jgi:hypothetical protein
LIKGFATGYSARVPSLYALTSELRSLVLTEDGDPTTANARASNAAKMAQKAARRGDKSAQSYWKSVYANAKERGGRAYTGAKDRLAKSAGQTPGAGHGGHGGGHGDAGGHGAASAAKDAGPKKSIASRVGGFLARAASKAAGSISSLPANAAKLASDRDYRREVGRKLADHVRKIPAKVILGVVNEVEEVVAAGGVLAKAAMRKDLTEADKHTLKAGAKALATTLLGTVAMGGIAHLTIQALASHFAIETAIKSVGKAALYTALVSEADEQKAMLIRWAEDVMKNVQTGFASLGVMTGEEVAGILS